MFKVIINDINFDIGGDIGYELPNPNMMYDLKKELYMSDGIEGPWLVRLIELNNSSDARLDRARVCYTSEQIYNFVKRTIERHCIAAHIHEIFKRH